MSTLKRRRYNIGYVHYDDQAAITQTFSECADSFMSTLVSEKPDTTHFRCSEVPGAVLVSCTFLLSL